MEIIDNQQEIRALLLDMLKFVDKICKENDIDYSLTGGTLLGAVRHKGFIPWDDDIDVFLTRDNYERFVDIFNSESKKYGGINPDYYYCFAKIVDNTTFVLEDKLMPVDAMGLYIDIFPLDKIADDIKIQEKAVKTYKRYHRGLYYSIKDTSAFKEWYKKTYALFCRLLGWRFWHKRAMAVIKKYSDVPDSHHRTNFTGCYGMREIVSSDYCAEYTTLTFEGESFQVLKEYDKYLKNVYGNYMQYPPENERANKHRLKIYKRNAQ